MTRVDADFRDRVDAVVRQIPEGRLMTYGQIAAYCDAPWAAWEVGQAAHYGDSTLPWQRVVNKKGGLASGYPGGRQAHKHNLESEGIVVSDEFTVDINTLLWQPKRDL